MADNVELSPASPGGPELITEEIGAGSGVHMPVSKIYFAPAGTKGVPVSDTYPFPCTSRVQMLSSAYPQGQVPIGMAFPCMDSFNNLMTRGGVFTDEGSRSDDFDAMSTALSGTFTFTNGSADVTATGSHFVDEVDEYHYIKLDADGEDYWVLVDSVTDDGNLVLSQPYAGTGGTGAASKTLWKTKTQVGGSITAANSICLIQPGTGVGKTYIFHKTDYSPMFLGLRVSVSQRIANQVVTIGFVDDPDSPTMKVAIKMDGTSNTVISCDTASSSAAGSHSEASINLPSGTSAGDRFYEVRFGNGAAGFYVDGAPLLTLKSNLPGNYQVLGIIVGIENTAPVTATTVSVHEMRLENLDPLTATVVQSDPEKLQASVGGLEREGQTVTKNPVITGSIDPSGKAYGNRSDAAGNQRMSIGDPDSSALRANVRTALSMTGGEAGLVVQALISDAFYALRHPMNILARVFAMAADATGRVRSVLEAGTLTTCSTCTNVTTVATVTTLNQMAGQALQPTLMTDIARLNWANTVRSRIT